MIYTSQNNLINHLLQLKIGGNCSTLPFYQVDVTSACYVYIKKNGYLDDSAHTLLMILHTNFEMFDDSTLEFFRMIVQVQH